MFFWHWAQRRSKKTDQMVMARAHGHALQPRWTEGDWPPVQRTPPQAGLPSLERNHAYHCRMTPGVFLGARCNHDLSILLRLPVLDERQRGLLPGKPHHARGTGGAYSRDSGELAHYGPAHRGP